MAKLTHNSFSTHFRKPYNSQELGAIAVFLSKSIFIYYNFVIDKAACQNAVSGKYNKAKMNVYFILEAVFFLSLNQLPKAYFSKVLFLSFMFGNSNRL